MGLLSFFLVASAAGFHDSLEVPVWVFRVLLFLLPTVVTAGVYGLLRLAAPRFSTAEEPR